MIGFPRFVQGTEPELIRCTVGGFLPWTVGCFRRLVLKIGKYFRSRGLSLAGLSTLNEIWNDLLSLLAEQEGAVDAL
jgi:hypothetical protein